MDQAEHRKMIIGISGVILVGGFVLLAQNAPQVILPDPVPATAAQLPSPISNAVEDKVAKDRAAAITSGEHCLSGWDGSLPRLKGAVKRQLRNPRSFEHVETVRSPVDAKGTFGLIMTYRAENGFGGLNLGAIGVEVDAATCRFHEVDEASLARRLRKKAG